MTPHDAKAIADFLIGNVMMESAATKRVFAAVPTDKHDYSPDDKSMKALDLVKHTAGAEIMILEMASIGGEAVNALGSSAEVVEWFDKELTAVIGRLQAKSPEDLAAVISVWGGAFTMPAVNFIGFAMGHSVHHRGQLSAYLRPMGAKVPSIYGPSGDSAS